MSYRKGPGAHRLSSQLQDWGDSAEWAVRKNSRLCRSLISVSRHGLATFERTK